MISAAFVVAGMSCGHCGAAVTKELEALPGVRTVSIQLASGRVNLTADSPIDIRVVETAVEQAGYHVVERVASAGGGV